MIEEIKMVNDPEEINTIRQEYDEWKKSQFEFQRIISNAHLEKYKQEHNKSQEEN